MKTKKANGKWYTGRHLSVVIVVFFLFWFYVLLSSGSTNSYIPVLCGIRGWNQSTVLVGMTIAGYVGAFASLFFGWLVAKKGAKQVSGGCLIACGLVLLTWAFSKSIVLFIIGTIIATSLAYGFQSASGPVLVSSWFPRKKGIVLGWATMGIVAIDFTWERYSVALITKFGNELVVAILAGLYVIFGIIVLLTVKNFPEECGLYPDNIENDSEKVREMGKALAEYKTPYTVKKCLRTKEVWQLVFGWQSMVMVCVCFVARVVPRIMLLGFSLQYALNVLLYGSCFALVGSWFFGFLDQKIGTKQATIIYDIWNILMFICCLLMPYGTAFIYIGTCGLMFGLGGIYNLAVSMGIQKFGRWDFVGVNKFVTFCQAILVSSVFAINALFLDTGLGFVGIYIFCIVVCIIS